MPFGYDHVELMLLVISLLFFASIFTDKLSSKFGIPALLLFLAVGMVFGEDGIGGIEFNNTDGAEMLGSIALCVILFAGGMGTKFVDIKPVIGPGVTLATVGVLLTWLFSGLAIWGVFQLYGSFSVITLPYALLLAATMSSTDAASVFGILGNKGIRLKHNLRPLLELESGSNDPMAYIITATMISVLTQDVSGWQIGLSVLISITWSVAFGLVVGFGFAKLMTWMMQKMTLSNSSLYPIMILTACIFIYSMAYFLGGNSYLAVYIGGLVIGNSRFPYKRNTMGFIDGLSWLFQLLMFLVLGLLVTPHNLGKVVIPALLVSAIMMLVARPLAVYLSLWPFKKFNRIDKAFTSWVGLKGAVPIVLAIKCASEGVTNSDILFNIAFVCTLVSLLAQGTSLAALAKRMRLTLPKEDRQPPLHFDISLPEEIQEKAIEVLVTEEMAPVGTHLMDLGLSKDSLVIMLRRGDEYIFPNGQTLIEDGDYLLLMSDQDHAIVRTYDEDMWELELIRNTGEFFSQLFHADEPKKKAVSDLFKRTKKK